VPAPGARRRYGSWPPQNANRPARVLPHVGVEPAPGVDDGPLGDHDQIRRVLTEVADSFLNFRVVALREAEEKAHLGTVPEVVATVPFFDTDIYDLAGLVRLGEQIWD